MSLIKTELEPKTLGEKMRNLRELAEHPGWKDHILPFLEELEKEHVETAISPDRKPEERAEHIHAIQTIRKIKTHPQEKILELEASWKNQQKKPPSA